MKISFFVVDGNTTCGECGHISSINEGASEVDEAGEMFFWCPYCQKKTVLIEDVYPNE